MTNKNGVSRYAERHSPLSHDDSLRIKFRGRDTLAVSLPLNLNGGPSVCMMFRSKTTPSWERHLLSTVAPTLSLKTVHRTVLTCIRNDCAFLAWHGRLRVPDSSLVIYRSRGIPLGIPTLEPKCPIRTKKDFFQRICFRDLNPRNYFGAFAVFNDATKILLISKQSLIKDWASFSSR